MTAVQARPLFGACRNVAVAVEQRFSAAACQASVQHRPFSSDASSDEETFAVTVNPYKSHLIDPPSREVETSKKELLQMYHDMYTMRRMETAAADLYQQKLARGFLHLADGQEAVPVGMEAGATKQDSMVQSYRDHLTYVARGGKARDVFAELLGRVDGPAEGKGGSMHLYSRKNNFYGGFAIVGEQCPIGAGIALAHKYRGEKNVCFTMYGDGAANQGQLFEAFNMAALWRLPVVFVCENNHYGMGTSAERGSKSAMYYKRGDYIPGLWVDGMDVLNVKNATAFAKSYAVEQGPIVMEMDTYRYHGHSISDPGSTYRTRDEIQGVRRARDPIEHVKTLLSERGLMDKADMKKLEKGWRKTVEQELEEAKKSKEPPIEYLWRHTYADALGSTMRPIEIGLPKVQLEK